MGRGIDTSKLQLPIAPIASPREDVRSAELYRASAEAVLDGPFERDYFPQDELEAFMRAEGIDDDGSKLFAIDAEFEVKEDRPSGTYNEKGELVERGLDSPDEVA